MLGVCVVEVSTRAGEGSRRKITYTIKNEGAQEAERAHGTFWTKGVFCMSNHELFACPNCQTANLNGSLFCRNCSMYLQTLGGTYRLVRPLSSGGFGTVYQGCIHETQIPVAIKVLREELTNQATIVARFEREAKLQTEMQHPHVVRTFEYGWIERLGHYLVMEWLDGRTLQQIVEAESKKRLPSEKVQKVFAQLLDGLQYVHRKNIVHRDLKPQNVMLIHHHGMEMVKILDFGIAKAEATQQLTRSGIMMGTPFFMAPEQVRGDLQQIGPATDIYAAGVMLAWALTGNLPFDGNSAQEILEKHRAEKAPMLRDLCPEAFFSEALESVVACALSKDVDDRFPSAMAFRDALTSSLSDPASRSASHKSSLSEPASRSASHKVVFLPVERGREAPVQQGREASRSEEGGDAEDWIGSTLPLRTGQASERKAVQAQATLERGSSQTEDSSGRSGGILVVSEEKPASFDRESHSLWEQTKERPVATDTPTQASSSLPFGPPKVAPHDSFLAEVPTSARRSTVILGGLGAVAIGGVLFWMWGGFSRMEAVRPTPPSERSHATSKKPPQTGAIHHALERKKPVGQDIRPAKRREEQPALVRVAEARPSAMRAAVRPVEPPSSAGLLMRAKQEIKQKKWKEAYELLHSIKEKFKENTPLFVEVVRLLAQSAKEKAGCEKLALPAGSADCREAGRWFGVLQKARTWSAKERATLQQEMRKLSQVPLKWKANERGFALYTGRNGKRRLKGKPIFWGSWGKNYSFRFRKGTRHCSFVWKAVREQEVHLVAPLIMTPEEAPLVCQFVEE